MSDYDRWNEDDVVYPPSLAERERTEFANRVCAPTRNRQRIVEEVERRYGRKAGEMITFAPLVPVENVVAFVIDAVEAMG